MKTIVFTSPEETSASLMCAYSLALTSSAADQSRVGLKDSDEVVQSRGYGSSNYSVALMRTGTALKLDPEAANWLKFDFLIKQWHTERGAMSSITEITSCPAYHRIMAMGPDAIPLIIAQLRAEGDEPDHWFGALRAITCEDPVRDENRGNYVKMAQAWLEWADRKGYGW
jgi:hypothetical protein